MIKSSIRHTLRLVGTTVAVLALVIGFAAWRISSGPVPLQALLPYAIETVNQQLTQGRLGAKNLAMIWRTDRRTLDLIFEGVAWYPSEKSDPIIIPFMEIALDGPSVAKGQIAPTVILLDQIALKISRSEEGLFSLGNVALNGLIEDGRNSGDSDFASGIVAELLGEGTNESFLSKLRSVEIENTLIILEDQKVGLNWRVPDGLLRIERGAEGLAASLSGAVRVADQDWRIDLAAVYRAEDRSFLYDLSFLDVEPALLSQQADFLSDLYLLAFPVSGNVNGGLDLDTGTFGGMDIALKLGSGAILLPEDLGYAHDMLLDGGEVSIWHEPAKRLVDVKGFSLNLRERLFEGDAQIRIGEALEDSSYLIHLGTKQMNLADLLHFWPVGISPSPHEWMSENMTAGDISDVVLTAASADRAGDEKLLQAGDDGLRLTFEYENTDTTYLKPLPPMTATSGRGVLNANSFELLVDRAQVGNLKIENARMFLPDINVDVPEAQIDMVISGSLTEALELLDHEPFNLISDYGIEPQSVSGKAATRLSLNFPLDNNLKIEQLKFAGASRAVDVTMPDFQDGLSLSGGDMILKVNGEGLSAEGQMNVNDVPMAVFWSEDFTGRETSPTTYKMAGTLSGDQVSAMGLPVDGIITGDLDVDLTIRASESGLDTLTGQAVLDRAGLVLDPIDWAQEPEDKGSARFAVRFPKDSGPFVNSFAMLVGDLEFSGSLQLRKDNSIDNFRMKKAKWGEDTILSAQLERREDLGYNLTIQGDSMDARPLLSKMEDTLGEEERDPISVWLSVNKVMLHNGERLRNLQGVIRDDGLRVQAVDLSAAIESGGFAALKMAPDFQGHRTSSIRTDNAGGLLRAFDSFATLQGGDLTLNAIIDDELDPDLMRGEIVLKDFVVNDTPLLARLLTVGSLTGIGDLLEGEGIRFSEMNVKLRTAKDWWAIDEGYAIGPSLGITAKGTVNREKETYDIGGTLVPAYTLNSLLGFVPLVGDILVGKKGEGIFAMTYGIKGTEEKPVITVNPLAALAPGFLRNIFGLEGDTPDDPANPKVEPRAPRTREDIDG